jgi:hypothetical protein
MPAAALWAKLLGRHLPDSRLLAPLPTEVSAAIRARGVAAMADYAVADGYELPGVRVLCVGRR